MTLEIERLEPGNGFRLTGEVDAATAPKLLLAIEPALDGSGDVTLDLGGLRFMDSTGVRVLLGALRELRDHDRRLVLLSPTPPVAEVLELIGLAAYGAQVLPSGEPRPAPAATDDFDRSFPADPEELAPLRTLLRRLAAEAGLTEQETGRVLLAVNEAATNAIVHGRGPQVEFRWRATRDAVEIHISDGGVFEGRVPTPELDGEGRRGIPVMMAVMDEVEMDEGTTDRPGTTIRLLLRRRVAASAAPSSGPAVT